MIAKWVTHSFFGVLLLCHSAGANTATKAMEDFPVPPRTQVWWAANGDVHNNQKVFIKKFKSHQRSEHIADFYRHTWKSDGDLPGYLENNESDWTIISRLTTSYHWVVQIRNSATTGGSEGFLSALPLTGEPNSVSTRNARHKKFTDAISGGDLLSSTESSEPKSARTQLHLFSDSPSRVASRFKSHMASEGWSLQDEYLHQGTVTHRYEHTKRQIDLAYVQHRGTKTLVFLNEVYTSEH